jgi:arylformamidase
MLNAQAAIDLTLPIGPNMLLYPGDSPPALKLLSSLERGDALTASELVMGCHVGTHVDAPAHFVRGGLTVDRLDKKHFFGPAIILDLTSRARVELQDVENESIPTGHHVLLKTRNSALLRESSFTSDYAYVTPEATKHLLEREPLSIGIDYYSLDPPAETDFPAHRMVAEQGLPAFVCLDLASVKAGTYFFTAFALPITDVEGIPVRALLWPSSHDH